MMRAVTFHFMIRISATTNEKITYSYLDKVKLAIHFFKQKVFHTNFEPAAARFTVVFSKQNENFFHPKVVNN